MASIKKRPDGKWRARYRDVEGREHARHFDRKNDAQAWLDSVTAALVRGDYIDPQAGKVRFSDFAAQWAANQTVDPKTAEGLASHLRAHLLPAFGALPLRAIRPSTVQQWVAAASGSLAPSYVRLLLSTLSSILGAAVEDGLILKNPCASGAVSAPAASRTKIVPWTVEQVHAAVGAMPERYRATAVLAAGCGLRQGEAFGLRVRDIDFLRHRVDVRQQAKHVAGQGVVIAPPKRGKTRSVPLAETVAEALAEHLRSFPAERDALVFRNSAGGPLNRGAFNSRVWKPAVVAAGLQPTRDNGFHALRHHYASVLLEGGVSIRALAEYLGHDDPAFTLRVYTHLMPASEDRARQAVDRAHRRTPADSLRTADPDE